MIQEMKLSIRLSSLMLAQWQQCHGEDEAEAKEVVAEAKEVVAEAKETEVKEGVKVAVKVALKVLGVKQGPQDIQDTKPKGIVTNLHSSAVSVTGLMENKLIFVKSLAPAPGRTPGCQDPTSNETGTSPRRLLTHTN